MQTIDAVVQIREMKQHLESKAKGKVLPQLKTIDDKVLPAAWSILRWYVVPDIFQSPMSTMSRCVASSTAYLEEISDGDEMVSNIGTSSASIYHSLALYFVSRLRLAPI